MKAIGLLMLLATAVQAGEREERYFNEYCLPLARTFLREQPTGYDPNFPTNKISHWKVDLPGPQSQKSEGRTDNVLSRISIERGHITFEFIGKANTNYVMSYADHSQWRHGWDERDQRARQLEMAAKTNLLNTNSALAMARACFRRAGHNEQDFHPVIFQQMEGGYPPIKLPLYRAEWRHLKLPLEKDNRFTYLTPVTVIVSGITSNLVMYDNLLPFK